MFKFNTYAAYIKHVTYICVILKYLWGCGMLTKTLCAKNSIVGVKPYRRARTLPVSEEFIRTFHSGVHSFEIWFDEKARILVCSSESEHEIKKRITSFYPAVLTYTPEEIIIGSEEDTFWIAEAQLGNPIYPIRTDVSDDPLSTLITNMVGHRVIYQVLFTPAPKKYSLKLLKASRSVQSGRVEGWINPRVVPPGKVEKDLSKALAEKARSPLYVVDVRLCVFGDDCEVLNGFLAFFELFRSVDQHFKLRVVKGITHKKTVEKNAEMMKMLLKRCMILSPFRKKSILSAKELALLAHIPGEETVGDVDWAQDRMDTAPTREATLPDDFVD